MYLQNAASLSRVDERRTAFLERRETIGRMGMRIPDADESSKMYKEEIEYEDAEKEGDMAKKTSAPASDISPAPIVHASMPARAPAPRAAYPETMGSASSIGPTPSKKPRLRMVAFSILAAIFVVSAIAIFGEPDQKFMKDRNHVGYVETSPAAESPIRDGSGIGSGS